MCAQSMYDSFDNERTVTYGLNVPFSYQIGNGIGGAVWPGWHGTLLQYTDNPATDGINPSPQCAEYTRNPAEFYDVIIINCGELEDLSDYISGAKTMSFDVFSPVPGITVQITLENAELAGGGYPAGRHSEYTATTTTGGQWETLTFALSNQPWTDAENTGWWPDAATAHNDVDQMVVLFNPASNTDDTYYIDNIMGPERTVEPCDEANSSEIILFDGDCEHDRLRKGYSTGRLTLFPDPNGENGNCYEYARNGGEETDVLLGSFVSPLDIPTGVVTTLSMDVYDSIAPSTVAFSIQDQFDVEIALFEYTITEPATWQTFEMDLSPYAGLPNASNFVILYEAGNLVAQTFYFDNVRLESVTSTDKVVVEALDFFPNPASEHITINGQDLGYVKGQILSMSGQIVSTFEGTERKIDVSSLSPGMYFVEMHSQSGIAYRSRLIVE